MPSWDVKSFRILPATSAACLVQPPFPVPIADFSDEHLTVGYTKSADRIRTLTVQHDFLHSTTQFFRWSHSACMSWAPSRLWFSCRWMKTIAGLKLPHSGAEPRVSLPIANSKPSSRQNRKSTCETFNFERLLLVWFALLELKSLFQLVVHKSWAALHHSVSLFYVSRSSQRSHK